MIKTISVIIPVYNEERNIKACLDSLENQSLKPLEIIVVDDGSSDGTLKIVKDFPVRVLRQSHQGPGPARNLAAESARGDILVFVDADMTFDPEFLKLLTLPISRGISKGVFNEEEYVGNYTNSWAKCWNLNQGLTSSLRLNPHSIHDTQDFRAIAKSEFLRVGGFSATGYTDSRTLVAKLGYRPTKAPGAISYHTNPDQLVEIFHQARWIGRRQTRLGPLGKIINLIRYNIFFSCLIGLTKAVQYRNWHFLFFKLIYDLGYFIGDLNSLFSPVTSR